jgi:DNA-binding FadR family transcriptional regulator
MDLQDAMTGIASHANAAPPRSPGRRLYGGVAHKLGVAILSGRHAPGETMPGEIAFAAELDISRGAVREALQVLAAKGMVESRTGTGTRVLPRERWNLLDPDVLGWAAAAEPDLRLVRSLFELKLVIEPAAAGMAALRRERADIARMRDALTMMRRSPLAAEQNGQADRDFHVAMLNATRNDAMIVLGAAIGTTVTLARHYRQHASALPRNATPDLVQVFDAIVAQDAGRAGTAMTALVERTLADLRDVLAA